MSIISFASKLLIILAAVASVSCLELSSISDQVNVTIYYESLCPFCRSFFQNQLNPTFAQLGGEILSLKLLPFGNAKITGNNTIKCQHGPKECKNNRLMACVQKYGSSSTSNIVQTLTCLFGKEGKTCVDKFLPEVDWRILQKCQTSSESFEMMKEFEVESRHIRYVPWIEINGSHNDTIQEACQKDLRKCICDIYQGSYKYKCN